MGTTFTPVCYLVFAALKPRFQFTFKAKLGLLNWLVHFGFFTVNRRNCGVDLSFFNHNYYLGRVRRKDPSFYVNAGYGAYGE